MEKREKYYKLLFFIGAIWNLLVSIFFAFLVDFFINLFGMQPVRYRVMFILGANWVFLFGWGYYLVSKNIYKNHALILVAGVGKIIIFFIILYYTVWIKSLPLTFIIPGVVDLIFGVLFLEFLIYARTKRNIYIV